MFDFPGEPVTAVERWRADLAGWAIPERLLAAVDESPYGWSQALWKRRSEQARSMPPSETVAIVSDLIPNRGTLLDVGAGRGRASLPVALQGHRVIAVDENQEMLNGLVEDARELGVEVETHLGRWPDIASDVESADVTLAANVAYNVSDIEDFLLAMVDHARLAAVLEVTSAHPWAHLGPLFEQVHGLERPSGPTAEDLIDVVAEVVGRVPTVARWNRTGQVWFDDWTELLEHYGRRLVVPRSERPSLRGYLEPHVVESEGQAPRWRGQGRTRDVGHRAARVNRTQCICHIPAQR